MRPSRILFIAILLSTGGLFAQPESNSNSPFEAASFSLQLPSESPRNFARFEALKARYENDPSSLTINERLELGKLHLVYGTYYTGNRSWSIADYEFADGTPRSISDKLDFQLPITNPHDQQHRKQIIALFEKAYANIELFLQVRSFLPKLVEAFSNQNMDSEETNKMMLEILRQHVHDPAKPAYQQNPFQIAFTASLDGRFQVDGIEQDRLAINTRNNILVNVNRLAEMKDLSFSKVVQLLLHEYSHLEPRIELAQRDAWSTKVSQWTQNLTSTWNLKDGSRYISVLLPNRTEPPKELLLGLHHQQGGGYDQFIKGIQKSFLLLKQDDHGTRVSSDIYDAFQTFEHMPGKSVKSAIEGQNGSPTYMLWPMIKVQSVRLDPATERLQVSYSQSSRYMIINPHRTHYQPITSSTVQGQLPEPPDVAYRIDHSPLTNQTETRILYQHELDSADFDVERVIDHGQRRFISVRFVKSSELKTNGQDIRLIAKDLANQVQISVLPLKAKILANDEILVQYEVPKRGLEISQLLIPVIPNGQISAQSEIVIRPSRKIQLQGPKVSVPSRLQIQKFSVAENLPGGLTRMQLAELKAKRYLRSISDQIDDEPTKLEPVPKDSEGRPAVVQLNLQHDRKVRGITLDVMHVLFNRKIEWNKTVLPMVGPQPGMTSDDEMGHTGQGRKYFIPQRSMNLRQNGNQIDLAFQMPFDYLEKIEVGPLQTTKIGWAYEVSHHMRAASSWDTGYREILGAWIHFDDGSVEKVPAENLPKRRFQTYAPGKGDSIKPPLSGKGPGKDSGRPSGSEPAKSNIQPLSCRKIYSI